MGILNQRDVFSSKWITAEITDASQRLHYVPIKQTLGDYFLAMINKQLYCFTLKGAIIKTYRQNQNLVKSFRKIEYDTSHYKPVSTSDNKALELFLKENSLPKVDGKMFDLMKVLSTREKDKEKKRQTEEETIVKEEVFQPHKLKDLVKELEERAKKNKEPNEYTEKIQNVINFLEHLKANEIVTPCRPVTDFIEGNLITTDAQFLGTIVSHYQRTDIEHKKITNTEMGAKHAWTKIIALLAVVGIIIGLILYIVMSGAISIPGITTSFKAPTADQLLGKYDTPESLKAAVDRGEIKYGDLPAQFKKMVDAVKLPTVTPQQHSVEIGATP